MFILYFPPTTQSLATAGNAFVPNGSAFQVNSHKWNRKCGFVWVCLRDFLLPFYFLKTGSDVAKASPDLPVYLRIILNLQVFCFHSPCARITDVQGVPPCTAPILCDSEIEPRTPCMQGKGSTNAPTSPAWLACFS